MSLKATQFYHAYRSLCPNAWTSRWDDQRGTYSLIISRNWGPSNADKMGIIENGNFPCKLDQ
jgi:cytochrome c oxidase subunit 6b